MSKTSETTKSVLASLESALEPVTYGDLSKSLIVLNQITILTALQHIIEKMESNDQE